MEEDGERVRELYRLNTCAFMGSAWMVVTLFFIYRIDPVRRELINETEGIIYTCITRCSSTYVSAHLSPFIMNVVRDHKCERSVDMRTACLVTFAWKAFLCLQNIVHVILVMTMQPYIYVTIFVCESGTSVIATYYYMREKDLVRRDAPCLQRIKENPL